MLRRLVTLLVALLLVALAPLGEARAAERESTPRDAPVLAQPQAHPLPPVPVGYAQKDAGWLRVSYPPSVVERVDAVIASAEEVRGQLEGWLGQTVLEHVDVRVARDAEEMAAMAPMGAPPPAYAVAVAYSQLHLVILSLKDPRTFEAPDLAESFRHELAHVALFDAVGGRHVPRWFHEGLAVHLSGEKSLDRFRTLQDATLAKTILPLDQLDGSFPSEPYQVNVAYAQSADFVRYLLRDADRARFASMISYAREGRDFDRALQDAYGTDLRKLEYQWREELNQRFSFLPVLLGGSVVWVVVIGLMAFGWVRRRRQAKVKLAEWEREDAAREAFLAAAATEEHAADEVHDAVVAQGAKPPMVEHEGRWYTLH